MIKIAPFRYILFLFVRKKERKKETQKRKSKDMKVETLRVRGIPFIRRREREGDRERDRETDRETEK